MSFHLSHIPALFLGTTFSLLGSIYPLVAPARAMLAYGLPPRLANSPDGQLVFLIYSSRITAIGLMLYYFYFTGQHAVVDTIFSISGVVMGGGDALVCWKAGVKGQAVFRGLTGLGLTALGLWGVTQK
jgi:hypothetical protein